MLILRFLNKEKYFLYIKTSTLKLLPVYGERN